MLVLMTCAQTPANDTQLLQGIELENPHAKQDSDQAGGTESYFSEYSGFKSLKKAPGVP